MFRPRGGLARPANLHAHRNPAAVPKKQRTLRIGGSNPEEKTVKTKVLKPSETRLKVRNLDEKQVTNEDLKKLFQNIGELKVCRFDRNEFGQFLGSATVTFERPEDAKNAVKEYNGAYLDDKVLTVEFDVVPQVTKIVKPSTENIVTKGSKTLGSSGKSLRLRR
jgi:THO complex subunit 4